MARIQPALADLGSVRATFPTNLLAEWAASTKTADDQTRILAPYRVQGTLVCSDSAGRATGGIQVR